MSPIKWDDYVLSKQKQLEMKLMRVRRSYKEKQREGIKDKDWERERDWYESEIRRKEEELAKLNGVDECP